MVGLKERPRHSSAAAPIEASSGSSSGLRPRSTPKALAPDPRADGQRGRRPEEEEAQLRMARRRHAHAVGAQEARQQAAQHG